MTRDHHREDGGGGLRMGAGGLWTQVSVVMVLPSTMTPPLHLGLFA